MSPKNSIKKRIFKIIKFFLLGVTGFILLGLLLFYINRDAISQKLLTIAKGLQPGDISIEEINLSLFAQFPNVSLRIDGLTYYENMPEFRSKDEIPVVQADYLYLSFDLARLIKGEIDISEITIESGEANIIIYPDSSVNLLKAMGISGSDDLDTLDTLDVELVQEDFEINLKDITLDNFLLKLNHQPTKLKTIILFSSASADFAYENKLNHLHLVTDCKIIEIRSGNHNHLQNKDVYLDVDLQFDDNSQIASVSNGKLVYQGLTFKMDGSYNLSQEGLVDLQLDASDDGMTLLSLFIEDDIIEMNPAMLDQGHLKITGSVKGRTINHFPLLEFNFNARNIIVNMPDGIDPIKIFGFTGNFRSGTKPNLSEATLWIKNLNAILPGGNAIGSIEISDFTNPEVLINWESKIDLNGFDRAFKLGSIDSLRGFLSTKIDYDGRISLIGTDVAPKKGMARIAFEDVTFRLPYLDLPIQKLNGSINQHQDHISIDSVSLQLGSSVALINGDLQNHFRDFIFPEARLAANFNIDANLTSLRSILPESINLPDNSLFNDTINNLEINLSFETVVSDLQNFHFFPPGKVQINHLAASLENLPDVEKITGAFSFQEDSSGANIGVENLHILLSSANLEAQGIIEIDTVRFAANFNIDVNLASLRSLLPESIYLPDHSLFTDSISDLRIETSIETTVSDLKNFHFFPSGKMQINHFAASLENLPDLEKLTGKFSFREDSIGIDIGVENLHIQLPLANMAAQGNIRIDTTHEISIQSDLNFQNVNLNGFVTHIFPDSNKTSTRVSKKGKDFLNATLKFDTQFNHTPLTSASISISDFDIFYVGSDMDIMSLDDMNLNFKNITFDVYDSLAFFDVLAVSGEIRFEEFKTTHLNVSNVKCKIDGDKGKFNLVLSSSNKFSELINNAMLSMDMTGLEPSYEIFYESKDVLLDSISKQYYKEDIMMGALNVSANLFTNGRTWDILADNATGKVLIEGKDLVLYGFDLDEILTNYKKSQNFTLTDVGAYLLVGPFGAVVTKGSDFARINNINPDDTTEITRFYSSWSFANMILIAEDVALTTPFSRITLAGGLDIGKQMFDTLIVAVVDKKGCSLMDQSVYGSFEDPEFGDLNVVGTLFGAVINVFKTVSGDKCEPIYTGTVQHPGKD